MKTRLLFILSLFLCLSGKAQEVRWLSTFSIDNPASPIQNAEFIGSLSGPEFVFPCMSERTQSFGQYHLGNYWVYRMDITGNRMDSTRISGHVVIQDMAVWNDETYLMAGFLDSLTFGGQKLSQNGFGQAFLRLDAAGQATVLWSQGLDSSRAFTVNHSGNLVVAGMAGFGGSAHLSEFNSSGQYLDGRELPNVGYVSQVSQNAEGDYLVSGSCMGLFFAMDTLTYIPQGTYNSYILCLDSGYQAKWVNGIADVTCSNLRHHSKSASETYITSRLMGAFQIGADTAFGPSAGNLEDFFLAKVDERGDFLWYRELPLDTGFHSVVNSEGYALDLDREGNIYWLGKHSGNPYLWSSQVYMNSYGGDDIWLCSWDAQGDLRWAKSFGGVNNDLGHSLTVLGKDSLLVSGSFSAFAKFDSLSGDGANGAHFLAMILPPEPATSVLEAPASLDLEVFPNPSHDQLRARLNLKGNATVEYRIMDLQGRQLTDGNFDHREEVISVSGWAKGLYFLEVRSGEWNTVRKFRVD